MSDAWTRRLELLAHLMRKGFVQTAEVATLLQVSRRKALEDLKALEEHGVPLSVHPEDPTDPNRTWRIEDTWRASGVEVQLLERLALLLGREVLEPLLGPTELGEAMEKLDRSLAAAAGGVESSDDELLRRFHLVQEPSKAYAAQDQIVTNLIEAVAHSYRVTLDYQTPSAATPRTHRRVRPLTLAIYRRGLYVFVAFQSDNPDKPDGLDKIGPLSVDRITRLEPHHDEPFDYPTPGRWSPTAFLRKRFGLQPGDSKAERVRLRFPPQSRAYALERPWMPEQQIEERPDGGLDIIFEAEGRELAHRILEWGGYCEVVEPASLRERVLSLAQAVIARHAPK